LTRAYLEVAVDDADFVEVVQREDHFGHVEPQPVFREGAFAQHDFVEVASGVVLHDEEAVLVRLEDAQHLALVTRSYDEAVVQPGHHLLLFEQVQLAAASLQLLFAHDLQRVDLARVFLPRDQHAAERPGACVAEQREGVETEAHGTGLREVRLELERGGED